MSLYNKCLFGVSSNSIKIEIQNSVLRSRLSYKVLLYESFDYTQQAQPKNIFILLSVLSFWLL